MPDMSDSTLANEPTDSTDAAEPTLPMLSTEPMLPMLSSEFVEPMLSIDPRDRWLRRDIDARVSWLMVIMVPANADAGVGID